MQALHAAYRSAFAAGFILIGATLIFLHGGSGGCRQARMTGRIRGRHDLPTPPIKSEIFDHAISLTEINVNAALKYKNFSMF